jgi:predicted permease
VKRGGWRLRRRSEIRAELEDHIRRRAASLAASGWPADAARAEAERRLGDAAVIESACLTAAERGRARRRLRRWVEEGWRDVAHGVRAYRRRPLFAAVAVVTTALAVGAGTAVFGVVDGVMLKPMPYPAAESVFRLYNEWDGSPDAAVSPAEYLDYLDGAAPVFSGLGVYAFGAENVVGTGSAERVRSVYASAGIWAATGVAAERGRLFTAAEESAGDAVVLLSHGYWQRRFGGSPDVVGGTLDVDGSVQVVAGVLPDGFRLPGEFRSGTEADLYLPLGLDRSEVSARGSHFLAALARLRPGVTEAQAEQVLARVATGFIERFPDDYPQDMRFGNHLVPVAEDVVGAVWPLLRILLGAVLLVVLIACANVTGLLLVRSIGRRQEFALRDALGAGRSALTRQLLAESAVLAGAGGLAGVAIAWALLRAFVLLDPPGLPRVADLRVDGAVLGIALALTVLSGLAFGLAPLMSIRRGPAHSLRASSRSITAGGHADRVRRVLVTGQLALALVLLAGAGLLARSFVALLLVDPGYETADRVITRINLPAEYDTDASRRDYFARLMDGVRALPGVLAVGAVTNLPLDSRLGDLNIRIEGREVREGEVSPRLDWQVVTPGWFDAMGMRILRGRGISDADDERATGAVVLNEAAVRLHFPTEDPIGRRFRLGGNAGPGWVTVVGIVNDVRHGTLTEPPSPRMYLAHRQFTFWNGGSAVAAMTVVAKTEGDPLARVAPIRRVVEALDPNVPAASFRTMDQVVSASLNTSRFALLLVGAFAALALLLASVGIYGVASYAAEQRTREVGIRVALGARPIRVLNLVLRQAVGPIATGLVLGVVGARLLTRMLTPVLFGIEPTDATTLLVVATALAAIALTASWVPARRATRIEPAAVLRSD